MFGMYAIPGTHRGGVSSARGPRQALLILGEVAPGPIGFGVLQAVASGQLSGLSMGGDGRMEISLTDRPAYHSCQVLGCGAAAADS
jgi:hypothetical protein